MSKKRRGGDELTGGTGDVNPQFLSMQITQTSNNSRIVVPITVPLDRYHINGQKVGAIEILKIFVDIADTALPLAAGQFIAMQLATVNFPGAANLATGDPRVILTASYTCQLITSGADVFDAPLVYDFTDGAGHGIIMAVDTMYLSLITGTSWGGVATGSVKILYRYKNIGLSEYLGIVQSQNQ